MFTKILTLVLLGSTLVLTNPVSQNNVEKNKRGLRDTIKELINQVAETFEDLHERAKANFEEVFGKLLGLGGKSIEISKEKLAELKEKYLSIIAKAKEAFEKKKNEWKPNFDDKKDLEESYLEELKENALKAFEEEIAAEIANLEMQLNEWNKEAKGAIKAGNKK